MHFEQMNFPALTTVAAAANVRINVPKTARSMTVHCGGAAGGTGCVITLSRDNVNVGGSFELASASVVSMGIAGLGEGSGVFPNQIRVAATTKTSIAFECDNPETLTVTPV